MGCNLQPHRRPRGSAAPALTLPASPEQGPRGQEPARSAAHCWRFTLENSSYCCWKRSVSFLAEPGRDFLKTFTVHTYVPGIRMVFTPASTAQRKGKLDLEADGTGQVPAAASGGRCRAAASTARLPPGDPACATASPAPCAARRRRHRQHVASRRPESRAQGAGGRSPLPVPDGNFRPLFPQSRPLSSIRPPASSALWRPAVRD